MSVEVLQDGSYVPLTSEQYSVTETDWEVYITLCESVEVDSECGDVDPVRISYQVGNWRKLGVDNITSVDNTATVKTLDPHNLQNGDQVIITDTGESDLEGTFTVTVVSSTEFSYSYLGTPNLSSLTGTVTVPEIPAQLEQAILEMVASMYTNRGDCSDSCGAVPCSAQKKAAQFKRRIIRTTTRIKDVCCCQ